MPVSVILKVFPYHFILQDNVFCKKKLLSEAKEGIKVYYEAIQNPNKDYPDQLLATKVEIIDATGGQSSISLATTEEIIEADKVRLTTVSNDIMEEYFKFLEGGYLDTKGYLLEDYINKFPQILAKRFQTNPDMNRIGKVYAYFRQIQFIEAEYIMEKQFQFVVSELSKIKPFLTNDKRKRILSGEFCAYMEKNIEMAKQNETNFSEGFLPHFEFLIAYYKP